MKQAKFQSRARQRAESASDSLLQRIAAARHSWLWITLFFLGSWIGGAAYERAYHCAPDTHHIEMHIPEG